MQVSATLFLLYELIVVIKIANSMEQNPSWEANRPSATQEIPCVLYNPKVHYHYFM